ncbi:MAG: hypothetical protein ACK5RL_20090 [Acidimicrobiales bacterium]
MNPAFRISDYFNNGVIRYWYLRDPAATDAQVLGFDFAAHWDLVDRYRGRINNTVRYYVQPGYGHGNGAFNLSTTR